MEENAQEPGTVSSTIAISDSVLNNTELEY